MGATIVVAVTAGAAGLVMVWAVRRGLLDHLVPRLVVEGTSMVPTVLPGDRLLVAPRALAPPRVGNVVALPDPRGGGGLLVKRVVAIREQNIWVEGDNPRHSTDSRHFGSVPRKMIRGRVVYRYAPLARSGPIPGR